MTAVIRLSKPCDGCAPENGGNGKGWCAGYPPIGRPCPSCVGGWLPDDGTVVALRKVIPCSKDDAIRALVAAARHQKDQMKESD